MECDARLGGYTHARLSACAHAQMCTRALGQPSLIPGRSGRANCCGSRWPFMQVDASHGAGGGAWGGGVGVRLQPRS